MNGCSRLRRYALSGVVMLAAGAALRSEPVAPPDSDQSPSLHEAVQAAYERSPTRQVLAARVQEVASLARRADSWIADSPALALRYQSDAVGSDDGLREYEAGVDLPMWRWGERDANRAIARFEGDALGHSELALRLAVAGAVRDGIWELALRQNNYELARREWQAALRLEQDISKRVELGELAKTDGMLARTETLRRQSTALLAEAELAHARDQYRALTGLERLPSDPSEVVSARDAIDPEHPALAEAAAEVRAAQARIRAVRAGAGGKPQLLLGGKRERGLAEDDYIDSLGVSFTLPIGTNAHTGVQRAEAARALAEAQARYDDLQRKLRIRLHEAQHSLAAAGAALTLAGEQNGLAQENLRLARIAFSLGEIDLVELLSVQSLAFTAERNRRELTIMREHAVARYNQAVGVLP